MHLSTFVFYFFSKLDGVRVDESVRKINFSKKKVLFFVYFVLATTWPVRRVRRQRTGRPRLSLFAHSCAPRRPIRNSSRRTTTHGRALHAQSRALAAFLEGRPRVVGSRGHRVPTRRRCRHRTRALFVLCAARESLFPHPLHFLLFSLFVSVNEFAGCLSFVFLWFAWRRL